MKDKIAILSPANANIKNVVRDFVYGCWCRGRRIGGMQMPPLNLLYVATVLKESGVHVELIDAGQDPRQYAAFKKRIHDFAAVILLSSTNSFRNDVLAVEEIKRVYPEMVSIFFGAHPTFMPEYCLRENAVDLVVMREPEHIIRDVVQKIIHQEDYRQVKGIAYRNGGAMVINSEYPFLELDDLPVPDRSFLPRGVDYFNPVVKRMPYTTMLTSRGCPAKCNFCTVPYFYGKKIRLRSASNVVQEMKYLVSLGYKEIFIRDETFTAYRRRNEEICNRIIAEKIDVSWIANARVDLIDRKTIALLKQAGCHMLKLGVESGNQNILENIEKGITLEQTRRVFRWCRELGMETHAHVMIGCPGETHDTLNQTIRFVPNLRPTTASFGIFTPYPGTPVFKRLSNLHPEIDDGTTATMEKLHTSGYYNEYFTDLTSQEIERYVVRAYRHFYLRPSYAFQTLARIRSFDELMRLLVAGSNIFSFSITGKN